jgi:hypothetical protein
MNFQRERVETSYSFYSVMVQEPRGWRLLVAPALTPEDACQALADLIGAGRPLDQLSDEDRRHIEQALSLPEQDDYEIIIEGRRHRLVSTNLVIPFEADGPCGPGAHDQVFAEHPWNLADQC